MSASSAPASAPPAGLDLLYLEQNDDLLPPRAEDRLLPGFAAAHPSSTRCPPDMLEIRGEYCIDRFEVTLVDATNERQISPFYHPTRTHALAAFERFGRSTRSLNRPPALPEPPRFQLEEEPLPRARSVQGVIPQGYLNAELAARACQAAGKRLCTLPEWVTACRGLQNRKYPYGEAYSYGKCNVHRASHPAAVLHGNASRQHSDPRLNLVADDEGPLLRRTGETASCRSDWGADAAYDMVGNLDEWIADGSFVGGFYARATREGCDARISSHAREYYDYSLGTRCCRSLGGSGL